MVRKIYPLLEWNYFSPFITNFNNPESIRSHNLFIGIWKKPQLPQSGYVTTPLLFTAKVCTVWGLSKLGMLPKTNCLFRGRFDQGSCFPKGS